MIGPKVMDVYQERACNLILAPQSQKAFDLNAEPAAVRDRYGRHSFGQGVLLARRLIEQGVPLVTVYWNGEEVPGGWDLHYKNYQYLKVLAAAPRPQLFRLAGGPGARGLLDETLVVWMGEFGRRRGWRTREAGATGAAATPWSWPAPVSSPAWSTADPTSTPRTRLRTRSVRKTWSPRSTTAWASARTPNSATRSAGP